VFFSFWLHVQRFFVTGGKDPKSVLSGFDKGVLATAFNVSKEKEIKEQDSIYMLETASFCWLFDQN
jgi:hypothetical protein